MKKSLLNILMFLLINSCLFSQNILNGDFEQGPNSGWTRWSKQGYNGLIGTAEFFNSADITPQVFPRSGQYMARVGGFGYDENYIAQTITLPNSPKIYLGFYLQSRAASTSECSGLYVGARVRVIAGDKTFLDEYLCDYYDTNDWVYFYIDLSDKAGQTLDFGFRADAANSVWSFLYIDDVSITTTVDVPENENRVLSYQLNQNYPNPFNPSTVISYAIGTSTIGTSQLSVFSLVTLKIYDILGKEVATLVNENKAPGNYEVTFNSGNLPSGIYFYKLQAGDYVEFKKMTILK